MEKHPLIPILVISYNDGVLEPIVVCSTSEEAEAKFLELCREKIWNFDEYTPGDIEAILDNGYEQYGAGNSICIHHLNLVPQTKEEGFVILRALDAQFGLSTISSSPDDLQGYMDEYLGVDWFIERGYKKEDGTELEEVPRISEKQISELGSGEHHWQDIEEVVYEHVQANFSGVVSSLFPDISG